MFKEEGGGGGGEGEEEEGSSSKNRTKKSFCLPLPRATSVTLDINKLIYLPIGKLSTNKNLNPILVNFCRQGSQ